MNPRELVEQCEATGVTVRLIGDEIKVVGQRYAVDMATERLRPHKSQILQLLRDQRFNETARQDTDLLARFQLDLVEVDPAPEELARVNNTCYRLVSVKGWTFEEAMKAAAKWVAANPPHPDEDGFIDVLTLWKERQ